MNKRLSTQQPLQTRLENKTPTLDRGKGDVDSSSHAAESADGSEVAIRPSQQLIPATTTCASCTMDVGAYFNPSTSSWTEHPTKLHSKAKLRPLTGKS